MEPTFNLKAKLWIYQGKGAWHFLTIDEGTTAAIKTFQGVDKRRGWKNVRVEVTIGDTKWKTSIFPEKKGTYLLPIKAAVRKSEKLVDGNLIEFTIQLI
jgi:hypothetical protein